MTAGGSKALLYGHRMLISASASARLLSASYLAASCSSASERLGQAASPSYRTRWPGCRSQNARSTGIIRAGFLPISAISVSVTWGLPGTAQPGGS